MTLLDIMSAFKYELNFSTCAARAVGRRHVAKKPNCNTTLMNNVDPNLVQRLKCTGTEVQYIYRRSGKQVAGHRIVIKLSLLEQLPKIKKNLRGMCGILRFNQRRYLRSTSRQNLAKSEQVV